MSGTGTIRHFGIVTQIYPPDPAAVGQHLYDLASELSRRGHRVTVFTSDRGYDDPSIRYCRREEDGNITILRLPFTSFGKGSVAKRLLSGTSLLAQATLLAMLDAKLTDVIVSTIPHLAGALGIVATKLRGVPFHYWLMDLNPDQIVALGKFRSDSFAVRLFDSLNRGIIENAKTIITLDRPMADRFAAKSPIERPIAIQPPWAPFDATISTHHGGNTFRAEHEICQKRVIMHAGNHSLVHPLDTLVDAIRKHADPTLHYFFVGGGLGKKSIEKWVELEKPGNVTLLPYQPLDKVPAMLSAADVHVVSVGNDTVGIVHPSKLYGALAAGRPVIVLGPSHCPAAQLVSEQRVGWHVEHGDVTGLCAVLDTIAGISQEELTQMGDRARDLASSQFSKSAGLNKILSLVL